MVVLKVLKMVYSGIVKLLVNEIKIIEIFGMLVVCKGDYYLILIKFF